MLYASLLTAYRYIRRYMFSVKLIVPVTRVASNSVSILAITPNYILAALALALSPRCDTLLFKPIAVLSITHRPKFPGRASAVAQ